MSLLTKIRIGLIIAFSLMASEAFSNQGMELKKLKLGKLEPKLLKEKTPPPVPKDLKLPFKVGENLKFDVYHETFMSKVLAGHTYMRIKSLDYIDGRWALKFQLQAVSAKWYDWVIVIKNNIEGYMDARTLQTLYLVVDKKEGSYTQTKTVQFDYKNKRIIEKETEKDKKAKYRQYELHPGVMDSYSILFLIRNTNLRKIHDIQYDIYSDGKVYKANAGVKAKAKVKVGKKKYKTYKVEVLSKVKGALEQRKGIFIYFTDDQLRIPALSEADVKVGRFSVEYSHQAH